MIKEVFVVRIGRGCESSTIAVFESSKEAYRLAAYRARKEAEGSDIKLPADNVKAVEKWYAFCNEGGFDYDESVVEVDTSRFYFKGDDAGWHYDD